LTPVTPSHNQAKHLFSQFTAKLGVEIWQIFTIITMILSFASTFLWFGLLSPNNLKNDLEFIDQSKALMYNAYQETFLEVSNVNGHTLSSDFDSCQFKFNQGYSGYERQNRDIQKRVIDFDAHEQKYHLSRKEYLSESGTQLTKSSFDKLFVQLIKLNSSTETQNKLQIDLVNQISTSCKETKQSNYKDQFISYLDSIRNLDFSTQFDEKGKSLKDSLYILNIENTMETADLYGKILNYSPTFSDILGVVAPLEQQFLSDIQDLEKWQHTIESKNTYLKLKNYYIYDQT
jgi:hypothetical protein